MNQEQRIREICIDLCLSYDDTGMKCDHCPILQQAQKAKNCIEIYTRSKQ